MNKFFVSRQSYYGVDEDDRNVVEIAAGGLDYANADMLVLKYEGEAKEYNSMVDAVDSAIEIAKRWQKDEPSLKINIANGFTAGHTLPFDAIPLNNTPAINELKNAAKEHDEKTKCPQCGEIGELNYSHDCTEDKFCSETCAELDWEDYEKQSQICQVLDKMAEFHLSGDDLMKIACCGGNTWRKYHSHPQQERDQWLVQDILTWHDFDELLQDMENYDE